MVFSNVIFLFVFLPIVLLLYFIAKKEYRNIILLAASLFFYAYGEPKMVFLMIISIVFNYYFALMIERSQYKKILLFVSLFYNLSVIFVFKYLGFTISIFNRLFNQNMNIPEIALPIGISFYTFQSISYVVDVYNKKSKPQRNIGDLGLYISLFPQLIAGPIVRYNSIAEQIKTRSTSYESFNKGAKRFICGFCKKVILSNNLSNVAECYFGNLPGSNSVLGAWVGSICFSLQIFYDFSGYSDMAIGLGGIFGFEFEENFNYPYISKSITDFWRRWHISLSRWFRDYVYIPLGGSKVSARRHILNLAIVWGLTGLWHGAAYSFIVWGGMYFLALVLEKYIIKPEAHRCSVFTVLYRVFVLLFVNFNWVIFNANGVRNGVKYCFSMIGLYGCNTLVDATTLGMLREYGAFIVLGIVFAIPTAGWISAKLNDNFQFIKKYVVPLGYFGCFMWAISFLVLGAHNPFIYFNF